MAHRAGTYDEHARQLDIQEERERERELARGREIGRRGGAGLDERDRGREAEKPRELGKKGWLDVAKRVRNEMKEDNLGIIAAGVAFYTFLALFPALAALVAIYGLVADPADVANQINSMSSAVPQEAQTIVSDQLNRVANAPQGGLSLALVGSLLLTLWSANKGMKNLVTAMNVAYDERETRGFIKLNLLTLGMTLGGILLLLVSIGIIAVIPVLLEVVGFGSVGNVVIDILRWPLLAGVLLVGLAFIYRYAPNRQNAQWRWISPGSILATVLLIVVSILFSIYVANFGSYNETYGTLGTVAVVLLWLSMGAFIVLLGAEVNAEAERQTRRDTTSGPPQPMGERGAFAADTLGPVDEKPKKKGEEGSGESIKGA